MKKVVLSSVIAGLSISGSCYGSLESKGEIGSIRSGNVMYVMPFQSQQNRDDNHNWVDLSNTSPWGLAKSYFHVNHPELERKLHTARVVSELAAIGVAVGVAAYYTSPVFHGVVDYTLAFPRMSLDYVKSRPDAVVGYLNSMKSPVAKLGWNVTKAVYHVGKLGLKSIVALPVSALSVVTLRNKSNI